MCNSIKKDMYLEEAIQALDAQNYGLAKQILIDGEQAAENSFVAKNE